MPLLVKDATGTNRTMKTTTDGANGEVAHVIVDQFGNPMQFTGSVDITADGEVAQVTVGTSANSIYAAGDTVGGLLTFGNAVRASGRAAYLPSVVTVDKDNIKANMDLVLFHSSATVATNNNPFVWDAADFTKVLGVVHIDTTHYREVKGEAIAISPAGFVVFGNGTQNIYGALILPTGSTPTYTTTTALLINLHLMRD